MERDFTEEELAAASYLFSPEYIDLLENAILARIATTAYHRGEHKLAVDLIGAIKDKDARIGTSAYHRGEHKLAVDLIGAVKEKRAMSKDKAIDLSEDIAAMVKKIEERMAALAAERDKLDKAISEAEDLKEDCREAYDHLQDARDALSRLV